MEALSIYLCRGRHLVFVRQPPPLLCENALSTSELYDKVPPTVMAPTSAGTAAAARSSSVAAASSQGGGGGSASFDHGHPGRNNTMQLQLWMGLKCGTCSQREPSWFTVVRTQKALFWAFS